MCYKRRAHEKRVEVGVGSLLQDAGLRAKLAAVLAGAGLLLAAEALAADYVFQVADIPFRFRINGSLRLSENFVDNTWTLGMTNDTDVFPGVSHREYSRQTGLQYEIPMLLTSRENFELFLRLQRLGRADYAPIIESNRYITLFGEVPTYHLDEMMPRIRTLYVDVPVVDVGVPVRVRAGLIPYIVGGAYAMGGKYEQYGVDLYNREGPVKVRLHYDRPDLVNGTYLGIQRPRAEEGNHDDTKGDFFAGDLSNQFWLGPLTLDTQVYAGLLRDETGRSTRGTGRTRRPVPIFSGTETNLDNLGTAGLAANVRMGDLIIGLEGARNFGEAESRLAGVPDIEHTGWMAVAHASYAWGIVTPRVKFLYTSSNSFSRSDLARFFGNPVGTPNEVIFKPRKENRAFSVYSPTNEKFLDSHYWKALGPLVATAAGYAVNFGIPRPGTFGDPHILENLMMWGGGLDLRPTRNLTISLDYYYLRAVEAGYGIPADLNNPTQFVPATLHQRAFALSPDLGHELDITAKYRLHRNVTIGLQTGVFLPGEYYRERRHPTDVAANPFSRTVFGFSDTTTAGNCASGSRGPCRAVRDPSPAYVVELGLTLEF